MIVFNFLLRFVLNASNTDLNNDYQDKKRSEARCCVICGADIPLPGSEQSTQTGDGGSSPNPRSVLKIGRFKLVPVCPNGNCQCAPLPPKHTNRDLNKDEKKDKNENDNKDVGKTKEEEEN